MHVLYRNKWLIAAGVLPALLVYFTFVLLPIANSAYFSFFNWDGFSERTWVGLKNYGELLRDRVFWSSFRNNIYFLLSAVFGQLLLGLVFAIVLNGKLVRGRSVYKSAFFMPVVLSTVVVSLFWTMMYNFRIGLINNLLERIGLEDWARNWLGEPGIAVFAVCVAFVWQYSGFYMIIFLAALQNVSTEVLEAAEIDGAGGLRKSWSITIPMISETIFTCVALCISFSLRIFDLVYVMTKGGPNHATDVMATYMYQSTFSSLRYGYGATISTAIIVLSFTFIFIARMLMTKNGER